LRDALLLAERQVHILGWDIHSETPLVGPSGRVDDGLPIALGPFLTGLLVPLVAVRFLLPYLFNYRTSAPTFRHLPLKEAATGALALVVVYVGCRLAASVVARVRDRVPSLRGTPPPA